MCVCVYRSWLCITTGRTIALLITALLSGQCHYEPFSRGYCAYYLSVFAAQHPEMSPRGQKRLRDGRTILHVDPANLKPEELEVLLSETIWDDPDGLEKLRAFKWMFDLLLSAYQSPAVDPTIPATSYDSVVVAKETAGVEYRQHGPQYEWRLRENTELSDGKLSGWAGRIS